MKLYAGIDLHSNNHLVTVINESDARVVEKRIANDLDLTLKLLQPFQQDLVGVAVESTFNWYWLVDGLMAHGFDVRLVNTAAVKQYEGLKHVDDRYDAFWLAHLMRLGILPTGYIYPKEQRGLRDLLRKRLQLVQHRTAHVLSVQNQMWRSTGDKVSGRKIKSGFENELAMIDDGNIRIAIGANVAVIDLLNQQIEAVEKEVLRQAKLRPEYAKLLTIYGVGQILALTIMLETGDIKRFPTVGDFASYCRCVDSKHTSNGKKKGEGNTKCGNKYLAWAFIEAAHFSALHYEAPRRFLQRKSSQRPRVVAIKALAHKLARASYYVMKDNVEFDERRLFS